MGLLRFLIVFLVLYFIFRIVLRPFLEGPRKKTREDNSPKALTDKILPCPTCGTYNPSKHAFVKGTQYFCNEACAKKNK